MNKATNFRLDTLFYTGKGALDNALIHDRDNAGFIVRWETVGNEFGWFKNPKMFFKKLKEVNGVDRTFHEVIHDNYPRYRLYADIDCQPTIKPEEVAFEFENMMADIFTELNLEPPSKYYYCNASDHTKTSLHIVCHEYTFMTPADQKIFWQYVRKHQAESGTLMYLSATSRYMQSSAIDYQVYTRNKSFRLVGNVKLDNAGTAERYLRPWHPVKGFLESKKYENYTVWTNDEGEYTIEPYLVPKVYEFEQPIDINREEYNDMFDAETVERLILDKVPNTTIREIRGNMIILDNSGNRKCIINGEDNTTDGSYCFIRGSKLYYGCHDSGCSGQHIVLHQFEIEKDFDTIWRDVQYASILTAEQIETLEKTGKFPDGHEEMMRYAIGFLIEALNKNYAITTMTAKNVICRTIRTSGQKKISMMSIDAFCQNIRNKGIYQYKVVKKKANRKMVDLAKIWLNSPDRNEKDNITFVPDGAPGDLVGNDFNTYLGMKYSKSSNWEDVGQMDALLRHIRENWCGAREEVYKYAVQWMAHCIQRPFEKKKTTLVLQSAPGSGKGLIMEKFRAIFGDMFISPALDSLKTYNGVVQGKLMLFFDETVWGGNKSDSGFLKRIISEESITVNEKFVPQYNCPNYASAVIASNGEWVVPADEGARRYLCLRLADTFNNESIRTNEWLRECVNTSAYDFFQYMCRVDLSDFDTTKAPSTDELNEQILEGMGVINKMFYEALNTGRYPDGTLITVPVSRRVIFEYLPANRRTHIGQSKFTKTFNKVFKLSQTTSQCRGERLVCISNIDLARQEFKEYVHMPSLKWDDIALYGDGEEDDN